MQDLSGYRRQPVGLRFLTTTVWFALLGLLVRPAIPAPPKSNREQLGHLTQFITIPAKDLPKDVRLLEKVETAPVLPIEKNPDIYVDQTVIEVIAGYSFKCDDESEFAAVTAAVAAIYYEREPKNEIGIFGLYYANQKSADDEFKALQERWKQRGAEKVAFPFIQKGRLLLHVWKDQGASDQAYKAILKSLRSRQLKLPDRQQLKRSP